MPFGILDAAMVRFRQPIPVSQPVHFRSNIFSRIPIKNKNIPGAPVQRSPSYFERYRLLFHPQR
jgi:hypothetical protein